MTKNNEQSLPNTTLTAEQKRIRKSRAHVSEFLKHVALLIGQGAVTSFDLTWDISDQNTKPEGSIELNSSDFFTPMDFADMVGVDPFEAQDRAATQASSEAPSKIHVEDRTDQYKDRRGCGNPYCKGCNPTKS